VKTADRPRLGAVVALGLGALAVVGATVLGWNEGVVLLTRSVSRLAEAGEHDVPGLVRAVRLAFLAVSALAAAAGWAIGHPLPLVVAAVIAGIDVIETSFLLLIVGRR
jgi:hypothetical protein